MRCAPYLALSIRKQSIVGHVSECASLQHRRPPAAPAPPQVGSSGQLRAGTRRPARTIIFRALPGQRLPAWGRRPQQQRLRHQRLRPRREFPRADRNDGVLPGIPRHLSAHSDVNSTVLYGHPSCLPARPSAPASRSPPAPAPPPPQRHVPTVGFFMPIGCDPMPHSDPGIPKHVAL